PREPPEALPSPILRGLSRPYEAALRLAPVRSGGAVAPRWRRGKRRGRGVAGGEGPGGLQGVRSQGRKKCFGMPIRTIPAHVWNMAHHARAPVEPRPRGTAELWPASHVTSRWRSLTAAPVLSAL